MQTLVFQLGTNNWQRQGEFAPGSGILHEAHHDAYNAMDGVTCYSIYPSRVQTSDDPQVGIISLDHDIPICESLSPVSSYRFHSMSEAEFEAYIDHLTRAATEAIDAAEAREGQPVSLAIAHHSFLNPLVLARVNQAREDSGRPRFPLVCFVHGTALKMYAHEKAGVDPAYPMRFLRFIQDQGVFAPGGPIDACAAISTEQLDRFAAIFDAYPREQMLLSPNGCNTATFRPDPAPRAELEQWVRELELATSNVPAPGSLADASLDKVVVFCGKFADWKRLDGLLAAAKAYEARGDVATLVIGSGPEDAVDHYHAMAYETLGLRNTWFVGPRSHAEIARLNSLADVGVYPSRNEPFGLVLIECMACGTPVIGMDSGGPRDFVDDTVGTLLDECEGEAHGRAIAAAVQRALDEDWKSTRGPAASARAQADYSVATQCRRLLADCARSIERIAEVV